MPYSSSPTPSATPSVPASLPNQANTPTPASSMSNEAVVGCVVVVAAFSLTLLTMGYKRYRAAQRSRVLKRQVAMLEAMWRINSTK